MVNTFVVADTPEECAKILDNKRLGKQRVEAHQIIDCLEGTNLKKGWINHPATLMWKGYVPALKLYFNAIVKEWKNRGFNNNYSFYDVKENVPLPWWFTCKAFQVSHKCALLLKDEKYYSAKISLSKEEEPYLKYGYVWPSNLTPEQIEIAKSGKLDPQLFAALGAGIPPEKRIPKDVIIAWAAKPNVNPISKRSISKSGKIYKDYLRAAESYNIKISE